MEHYASHEEMMSRNRKSYARTDDSHSDRLVDGILSKGVECVKCDHGWFLCNDEIYCHRPSVVTPMQELTRPGFDKETVVECDYFIPKRDKLCGTCRWHESHRCTYEVKAKIPAAYRMDDMIMYDTDGYGCPCYEDRT